ncbi:DUF5060 domain-containing protein [Pelagicoccus sp. SDUM812003]|uniref:DUF5060 domain-containing protein n=1 Tax=Pelagicoccus sp. SDUM812003 TaxID=3041267 RepID=UPI0028100504|nr:DUF5060 domain-containing protein [Pelagicoccus sp. SDUM812003]MDQ8201749.1 DUF5060 domain-containing protein [Pelagicoccus sp. SDUM812003]
MPLIRSPRRASSAVALFALLVCALSQAADSASFQWQPITLRFEGPQTSETAEPNPFTSTRLLATFTHQRTGRDLTVRGFYAADGNAAHTSAEMGNVWLLHFTPDLPGRWTYNASLRTGPLIAISDDPEEGSPLALDSPSGAFDVLPASENPHHLSDFTRYGRLTVERETGYFQHRGNHRYFLKGGADSPENFLAYVDFDGTYRHSDEHREGESQPTASLHRYQPHLQDWQAGDPTWKDGNGKGIIGALNYLASTGMNAVYMLTMNIGGDGKDVWPYLDHQTFDRFDCSKLAQWEIVFRHAQSKGILLHLVTQETENERLLDDGETGTYRKLYYKELVSRFAHHNAVVWNLGEENGPADFSPHGQTSAQQLAMASYLKAADPYRNPVVIHTHAHHSVKDELLPPLLGFQPLDGLSFQVDDPLQVHSETIKWIQRSREAGHRWLISMDEIGPWQVGVPADVDDPGHDTLRRHVLWGSLMAGAAGVEWYFGAHQKGNDLDTEDWRSRAEMWRQTDHALEFFREHVPFWNMEPADHLTPDPHDYCLALVGETYLVYTPTGDNATIELGDDANAYRIDWYDPENGGSLTQGSLTEVSGPGLRSLGEKPHRKGAGDWVILLRKQP